MTKEELLKEQILAKFGSIKKFSEESKIPDSTIRNIFSRGLDGVGVATAIKICRALGLDMESLIDGQLSTRPNAQQDQVWSAFAASDLPSNVAPLDLSRLKRIPILGKIACGKPIIAEEYIEGYTYTDLNGGAKYFALRVRGDSMNAARINEDDIVIVRQQDAVDNGQIAVVLVDGEDATLKRFRQDGYTVTLTPQSTNPEHQTLVYDTRRTPVRILGLVVRVEFAPK